MKKLLSFVLVLSVVMFASSLPAIASAETIISLSEDNLGRGASLAGFTVLSEDDGSITSKSSNISFYLPEALNEGDVVTVHVKGSSDGDFRMWFIDVNETTNSDIYQMSQNDFTSGEFDRTFELAVSGEATEFFFKAPTHDGSIDNLKVSYLSISSGGATETVETEVADTEAAVEQAVEATPEATPKTGVTSNAGTYIALMAVAVAGLAVTKKKLIKE